LGELTLILERAKSEADPRSAEELLSAVYNDLRNLAASKLAREAPGQTLQATALVHEAWLRLERAGANWQNRAHFFSAAAEAMRRILIEVARRKSAVRHGGGQKRVELDTSIAIAGGHDSEMFIRLNALIEELALSDPFKAEVVKLKYFVGLENAEIGKILNVSDKTVQRAWNFAKVWLMSALQQTAK
jgi:RNA polymerase sigma factor (TIGR02999 family)